MSLLYILKGKRVREVDTSNGYLSLFLDDGDSGLHIFNSYVTSAKSVHDLTGKIVQDVTIADDHWRMGFQDGAYLQIGMRDRDYNGPESVTYFASGHVYVDQYAERNPRPISRRDST